jgi:uncharacterized protein YndB with AHSA1/START domain
MTERDATQHGAAEGTVSPVDQALGRLTPKAVRDGTGRDWSDWLDLLDAAGAAERDHRGIVEHLEREHPQVTAWWQQSLAVAYERARGKRAVGQTADVGFQVGAQRSVPTTAGRLWDVLTTQPELWLGAGAAVVFEPGRRYEVLPGESGTGASGEIRVVKPGNRIRMTWQPEGWPEPAMLQITLSPAAPARTRLNVHVEKLPDAETREAMRERMRAAMERVAAAASGE